MAASPRPVRYCGVCGARVSVNSRTYQLPIAYCQAHSNGPALDALPPDPLTSLPVQAAGTRLCVACQGSGRQWPDLECSNCAGTGHADSRGGRGPSAARERGQ